MVNLASSDSGASPLRMRTMLSRVKRKAAVRMLMGNTEVLEELALSPAPQYTDSCLFSKYEIKPDKKGKTVRREVGGMSRE